MTTLPHVESEALTGRYKTLLRISETIAAHRDSKELFRTIAGTLRQIVSFDFLSVVLYDQETHTLKLCVVETPGVQVDTEPRGTFLRRRRSVTGSTSISDPWWCQIWMRKLASRNLRSISSDSACDRSALCR